MLESLATRRVSDYVGVISGEELLMMTVIPDNEVNMESDTLSIWTLHLSLTTLV